MQEEGVADYTDPRHVIQFHTLYTFQNTFRLGKSLDFLKISSF